MIQEFSQILHRLTKLLGCEATAPFVLFGFGENRACSHGNKL